MDDPILDRLLGVLAGVAGPSRMPSAPGAPTPLGEGGFWLESVDVLELILACEEEFETELALDVDLPRQALATVGTLADAIRRRLGP
jgi:hypothetical protein